VAENAVGSRVANERAAQHGNVDNNAVGNALDEAEQPGNVVKEVAENTEAPTHVDGEIRQDEHVDDIRRRRDMGEFSLRRNPRAPDRLNVDPARKSYAPNEANSI